MKTRDVKRIIQQSAREEFFLNPGSFAYKSDSINTCYTDNISQWAINMWESRTDEEIARDVKLGLHVDYYIVWTFEEFRKGCLEP